MPDIDRVEYGLRRIALREWLGYVWVCLAEEPPSFEDDVMGAAIERLGDVALDRPLRARDAARRGRRIRYDVQANWKLIIENFMECYHCATIHPELTEVLPEFADGYAAQYFVGHGAEFGEDVKGFTVDGSDGARPDPGCGRGPGPRYYAITVRPQCSSTWSPTTSIIHRMFPLAADPRSWSATGSTCPTSWSPARTSAARWSCSTASTSRTSTPASAASRPWLTRLPPRRGAGAHRASHRRVPRLAARQAHPMTAPAL